MLPVVLLRVGRCNSGSGGQEQFHSVYLNNLVASVSWSKLFFAFTMSFFVVLFINRMSVVIL